VKVLIEPGDRVFFRHGNVKKWGTIVEKRTYMTAGLQQSFSIRELETGDLVPDVSSVDIDLNETVLENATQGGLI